MANTAKRIRTVHSVHPYHPHLLATKWVVLAISRTSSPFAQIYKVADFEMATPICARTALAVAKVDAVVDNWGAKPWELMVQPLGTARYFLKEGYLGALKNVENQIARKETAEQVSEMQPFNPNN